MARVFDNEGNVAVDAGAAVPAGVGRSVAYLEQQGVLPAVFDISGYIEFKRGVAVFPVTSGLAVDKEGAVHINTVEAQEKPLTFLQKARV
jgi:hypothetical protein